MREEGATALRVPSASRCWGKGGWGGVIICFADPHLSMSLDSHRCSLLTDLSLSFALAPRQRSCIPSSFVNCERDRWVAACHAKAEIETGLFTSVWVKPTLPRVRGLGQNPIYEIFKSSVIILGKYVHLLTINIYHANIKVIQRIFKWRNSV